MTLTQLAEKHNIDPVAFRLALQEWIDGQPTAYFRVEHFDGSYEYMLKENWQKVRKVTPLIARPSLD
jgi:hypothetical protein